MQGLPPGFKFRPTDEGFTNYLMRKAVNVGFTHAMVCEVDKARPSVGPVPGG
jgi:hypothetical protein